MSIKVFFNVVKTMSISSNSFPALRNCKVTYFLTGNVLPWIICYLVAHRDNSCINAPGSAIKSLLSSSSERAT